MLKFILPAAVCMAAASIHNTEYGNAPATHLFYERQAPPQKIYRDSIYIDSKAIPATIYENMWMMRAPADKKDSAAAKQWGIENYFTWQQRQSSKNRVPPLRLTDDGLEPFYIPPAQLAGACRRFEVWGNYCILKLPAGFSGVSLTNTMYLAFSNSIPADTLAKLLRQYRLQITSQGNGPDGVYATSFRRGEQIARISRKLRYHPLVKNITNYLGNQPPPPLDR